VCETGIRCDATRFYDLVPDGKYRMKVFKEHTNVGIHEGCVNITFRGFYSFDGRFRPGCPKSGTCRMKVESLGTRALNELEVHDGRLDPDSEGGRSVLRLGTEGRVTFTRLQACKSSSFVGACGAL